MGRLPVSVSVSAALHVAAVAWVATREVTREADGDHVVEPRALTAIELVPPPTEVELVDEPAASEPQGVAAAAVSTIDKSHDLSTTLPATPSLATSGTSRGEPPATALATSGTSRGEPPATPREPGTRSPYLDMRRGARADLTLPGTRDDLDRVPAGTSPRAGVPATGKLAPDGTGHKSDQGSFVAKVDRDGGVTIKDRRDFSIRWAVPTPKLIGKGIADWYESDKGPDGKRGKRTLENELSGTVDRPTMGCEDGPHDNACTPDRSRTIIVPVFRGGFNPTDWLMRRTVGDPYASKKGAYLDATRDERAQIRANHRAEQLAQTSVIVRANLERAWASTTDMTARKLLLFELWDETVEPAEEDSALAAASRAARAQVIGFIRAHLPPQSKDAYRADELAALNAKKQSKATFSPYE